MKIVQVCLSGSYNPNLGYQDNILPRYYKQLGLECVTITSRYYREKGQIVYSNDDGCTVEEGIRVVRLPDKWKLPYSINNKLRAYKGVYDALVSEKPDIIFLHNFQTISIFEVIRYCREHREVKVYADSHTDYVNSMQSWLSKYILHGILWKFCVKKLIPYVKIFWGVTEQRCQFMNAVYNIPADKIKLLVMGADSQKIDFAQKEDIRKNIRAQHAVSASDFVIVTGGKIDRKKNIHLLVSAIKALHSKNIKLMIFGKPEEEMRECFENEICKEEFVVPVGWIDADKVYDYFLSADLAAFPGTHSVLWEQAVGSGLPCVFKHWEGMTHVDVGGNCILLKDDSEETLAHALKKCIEDKALYNRMKTVSETVGVPSFSYLEIAKRSIEMTGCCAENDCIENPTGA